MNVRLWRKQKKKLNHSSKTRKTVSRTKTGRFREINDRLDLFVKQQRVSGFPLTVDILQAKAREIYRELGFSVRFTTSRAWICRFMKTKGFSLRRRTSICQRMPSDFEGKLDSFFKYVISVRKQGHLVLSQIGNADQRSLNFDMPPNCTVESTGAKQVKVLTGNEKLRMTVMLSITADGNKLPSYVIFKTKTFPNTETFPQKIHVTVQENGWITKELVKDWLQKMWFRRPGAGQLRSMLVLDLLKGHVIDSVKTSIVENRTDLVVVLGGMIFQL